jgi:tRNA (cmo5U34)-methyltransferase
VSAVESLIAGDVTAASAPADTGYAPAKWEFDSEVTRVFDDMLARSIPQYDVMRKSVVDMAKQFVQPHTDVVDLGCSRGEAIAPLVDEFGSRNRFIGVEVSPPMLASLRERFKHYIDTGVVVIQDIDLRGGYPEACASVTLSVLTLQFVPLEHRQKVVRQVFKSTVPGGAFIMVEKVLGNTAEIDETIVKLYHQMKRDHGYSQDEIDRKRLSLEGVLVPVTASWNEEVLAMAGFRQVDCFWRWMNFAAWVAVRE